MFECMNVYFKAVRSKKCEKAQQPAAAVVKEQTVKKKNLLDDETRDKEVPAQSVNCKERAFNFQLVIQRF